MSESFGHKLGKPARPRVAGAKVGKKNRRAAAKTVTLVTKATSGKPATIKTTLGPAMLFKSKLLFDGPKGLSPVVVTSVTSAKDVEDLLALKGRIMTKVNADLAAKREPR